SEGNLLSDPIDKSIIDPSVSNHKIKVGLISSEDMGDFLSHVAIEEEAVDPDLDLDLIQLFMNHLVYDQVLNHLYQWNH
ncbi:unnamed protein product, partial [Heterobilharzia americana]